MKPGMEMSQSELTRLLAAHEATAGLTVRVHGDHLILGRREPWGPEGEVIDDDRVRLTRLGGGAWGLSVRRHTGRWERTPFCGPMAEMVETILGCMQHLVAPY